MNLIDMDALRRSAPRLYRTVTKLCGLREPSGKHEINILRLPDFTRGEMFGWLAAQVLEPVVEPAAAVVVKPAAPAPVEPPKPEPQVDIAAHAREVVAREEAELKRLKDESRGIARLQQYSDEQGLEETPENLAAVQTFINEKVRGYWSQEIVDATIQNLGPRGTNVLTWKPKTAPAPPPPTPAEPSGEILQPWQLKIDATEQEMKAASVVALKDLIARRRKEHPYIRPRGSFSSQF